MKFEEKKKTKIVATIGPATDTYNILEKLNKTGVNIVRLNFSHDTHTAHQEKINHIKKLQKKGDKRIAILQDLSGPKIRTGELSTDTVELKPGRKLTLTTKSIVGDASKMSISYKKFVQDVAVGSRVLLNDGKQELKVLSKTKDSMVTKIVHGGVIKSRRGVNLPDTKLSIPALTTKDKKDLVLGMKNDVDFIALSFVQTAKDILDLKKILQKNNSEAQVVAKIETTEAIKNIEEIIAVSDAIMVARGDLAVEIGAERVPMLQKSIIAACNAVGKPVIVATQMLESMTRSPVPTRAEVSDVSNAILDGADAVMLSEETTIGKYPLKVVSMMKNIALETEQGISRDMVQDSMDRRGDEPGLDTAETVSHYAVHMAHDVDAKVIVAFTESGSTARLVSRFRPAQPVLAISPNEHTLNRVLASSGVYPAKQAQKVKSGAAAIEYAKQAVLERKMAKRGDRIVLVTGTLFGTTGSSNTVQVIRL